MSNHARIIALVVQKVDKAIHRINHYPVDKDLVIHRIEIYPVEALSIF